MPPAKLFSYEATITTITVNYANIDFVTINPTTGFKRISFCVVVITENNNLVELVNIAITGVDPTISQVKLFVVSAKFILDQSVPLPYYSFWISSISG
jgi:hypothetical protein